MPSIPTVSPFVPQEYTPLYVSIDDQPLTEVQSITINRMDGGATVETLMREWAGRVKGAAKAEVTLKGVIPYAPTDTGGVGFSAGGMTVGGGVQLDAAMLTSLNQNGNVPVKFAIAIGSPPVQQLIFKGYITSINVDAAIGKQSDFTVSAEGQFQLFQ